MRHMLIALLKFSDPLVVFCFILHDLISDFVAKRFLLIKRILLVVAYISLFWIFFPAARRDFGNFAEVMLLGILFLSPLSKIFRIRLFSQMMGLRRELGILMGCFALVHGVAYFVDPASFSLDIAPYLNADFFSMQPLFYFGILSLIFTLPLLFTSNTPSLRFLGGKKWKMLHRVVYVLLLTMLLHTFFLKSSRRGYDIFGMIQPVSIVLAYVLLKALAWKNFLPFLRDAIVYIGERYETFLLAKKMATHPQTL